MAKGAFGEVPKTSNPGAMADTWVAVTHPDLFAVSQEPALQQVQLVGRGDKGAAKFGCAVAAFNLAAQLGHHGLLAIADA